MTIEDPVEYVFPSINQIQINEQAGITFAGGLQVDPAPGPRRHPRRRDPRRRDGAHRRAVGAHRPLRALVAARHRRGRRRCTVLDMGIESFLVASSVTGVVGSAWCAGSAATAASRTSPPPRSWPSTTRSRAGSPKTCSTAARAATSARTPATRSGSACTSCCRSPSAIRELILDRAAHDETPQGRPFRGHADPARGGGPPGRDRHHHRGRGHALDLRDGSLRCRSSRTSPCVRRARWRAAATGRPSREAAELALYEQELRNIRVVEKKSILKAEITPTRVKREEVMHLSRQLGAFIARRAAAGRRGPR